MIMVNFKSIFVLTGIIFSLIACSKPEATVQETEATVQKTIPDRTCVAGFVQTRPNRGNIEVFTKSGIVHETQTIVDVSLITAAEITEELGIC